MLMEQRHAMILNMLNSRGAVNTADLVRELRVSSETIRKDLVYLDEAGSLCRIHGGAIPVPSKKEQTTGASEYVPFQKRDEKNQEEKKAIAEKAMEFIQEGQNIALDYGSTSQYVAKALVSHFKSLTVITNSVRNALLLSEAPDFTVILTGGILQREEYSLVYDFSMILNHLNIDLLFMSVSGIDPEIGCTDQRIAEVTIQNQLRNAARRTIVLADSSKFGRSSLVRICSLDAVDAIVTDQGVPADLQKKLLASGVNLVIA